MMQKSMLHRDQKGIGAVEFALVAPVLISFIIGISQVGRMFYANADMKSATAAGARLAELYPTPDDATIIAAVRSRLMRKGASAKATPSVVHGTDSNGNAYIEVKMTYSVPLDFIFFSTPPVTLHDTRRVFTQIALANATTFTSTTSSTTSSAGTTTSTTSSAGTTTSSTSSAGTTTSTTSGSTTSGSTTSASSTSSAGTTTSSTSSAGTTSTTSASSTSATSAGGSTSATSASSTSASSTTSASSSGSNASSGSNNGSSGHAHGDCKKC